MLHKRLKLVGYIRTGGTDTDAAEQRRLIQEYCEQHQCHLIGCSEADKSEPSFGLQEALDGLNHAEGIIALDLNRFVRHADDRLMDLRPFIEHLHKAGKVLITINDRIETLTAHGQRTMLDLLNEWSDRESVVLPKRGDFESADARGSLN